MVDQALVVGGVLSQKVAARDDPDEAVTVEDRVGAVAAGCEPGAHLADRRRRREGVDRQRS